MAMTTASQSAPGLQAPTAGDDMDITSEFHHNDDIEIDLDLDSTFPLHQDEDLILEDAAEPFHQALDEISYEDDDIMFDDDLEGEGMVQDNQDNLTIPDEHLTDASELAHDDSVNAVADQIADPDDLVDYDLDDEISGEPDTVEQTLREVEAEYAQTLDALASPTAEQVVHADSFDEIAPATHVSPPQSEQVASPSNATFVQPVSDTEATSSHFAAAETTQSEEHPQSSNAPDSPGEKQGNQYASPTYDQSESPQAAHGASQDPAMSLPDQDGETYEPNSTPLHPVTVLYHENQISLFPPREENDAQTYFLEDESIAHQSIYELLQACRTVLGDTIREEDELEMDIAELGLCISEDCTFAPAVSFAHILDTYIRLHQQDGVHEPDPLCVTLITKTRFSSRLNKLNAAALQGQGLSQITFLGHSDEDDPEYPHDSGADNEYAEHDDAAAHEQEQQPDLTEGAEGEHHEEAYADYNVLESHDHAQEGADNGTYDSAVSNLQGLDGADDQSRASALDPQADFSFENRAEKKGTLKVDISVSKEQAVAKSEHKEAVQEARVSVLEEEDLIDYSDDEEDPEQTQVEDSVSGPSSGSSTVQGDLAQTPKASVGPGTENDANHLEDGADDLAEFDFGAEDQDAVTWEDHLDEAADPSQPRVEGHGEDDAQDQDFERELEQELERELENEAEEKGENGLEADLGQPHGHEYNGVLSQEQDEYGEGFDAQNAVDVDDQYQYNADIENQVEAHEGQELYDEAQGEGATEGAGNAEGQDELDFDDNEHGDFDYPEFNDNVGDEAVKAVETPKKNAVHEDAGHDSDSINYDDDDESPPEPTAKVPEVSGYRPTESTPNKRSLDDEEVDFQDAQKRTRLD